MLDNIPSWTELFRIAPIATMTLTVAGVGFFSAVWIKRAHIKDLKEFIDYLKRKQRGNDD